VSTSPPPVRTAVLDTASSSCFEQAGQGSSRENQAKRPCRGVYRLLSAESYGNCSNYAYAAQARLLREFLMLPSRSADDGFQDARKKRL
jgi:hypothetical protein